MSFRVSLLSVVSLLFLSILAGPLQALDAQDKAGKAPKSGNTVAESRQTRGLSLPASVQSLAGLSVMLGQASDSKVTFNLTGNRNQEVRLLYGTDPAKLTLASPSVQLVSGSATEIPLAGLSANTEYFYRVQNRSTANGAFVDGPTGRWRTQAKTGSSFSFAIIGDSHPERSHQFDPDLYIQTLSHIAAAKPDFFLTIGDDFSVDTLPQVTRPAIEEIYQRQRLYLSLVGSSAPVYLVNGNHEQASLANLDGSADNVAVWAQNLRNRFFPQPAPDGFYSGDAEAVAGIGLLRDYYAWTWGDALFVVIDPYWHSPQAVDNAFGGGEKTRDLWNNTLGDAQYAWLKKTLESSTATFKFVFSHHVLGTGRGGIELANSFEWGGQSTRGASEFAAKRPGWPLPIHQLLAKNRVTAFVQGHDHIFANQVLDGVSYITLPEPADPNYALYNKDAFRSGDTLPNSGWTKFTVSPDQVTVEYWREWLPSDRPAGANPDQAAYRFIIPAGGPPGKGIIDAAQNPSTAPTEIAKPQKSAADTDNSRKPGRSVAPKAPKNPSGKNP